MNANARRFDPDPPRSQLRGVAQVTIKFIDYIIPFSPNETVMVATARVSAWLNRYPLARTIERYLEGGHLAVCIEIDESCPDEWKTTAPI
jgi:hypothetical protein